MVSFRLVSSFSKDWLTINLQQKIRPLYLATKRVFLDMSLDSWMHRNLCSYSDNRRPQTSLRMDSCSMAYLPIMTIYEHAIQCPTVFSHLCGNDPLGGMD